MYGHYGQNNNAPVPPKPAYGFFEYAMVAGVGALIGLLGGRTARLTPILFSAAVYTLGFWIRGRVETPKLLAQVRPYMPEVIETGRMGPTLQASGDGPIPGQVSTVNGPRPGATVIEG